MVHFTLVLLSSFHSDALLFCLFYFGYVLEHIFACPQTTKQELIAIIIKIFIQPKSVLNLNLTKKPKKKRKKKKGKHSNVLMLFSYLLQYAERSHTTGKHTKPIIEASRRL